MSLIDTSVALNVPSTAANLVAPSSTTPGTVANAQSGSVGTGSQRGRSDMVTLNGSSNTSGGATYSNVASTNSASAASAQNKNAVQQASAAATSSNPSTSAAQNSDGDADYSQAIRSLSSLNKMTMAYNKAIGAAADSTAPSQSSRALTNTVSSRSKTDNTQMATDLSRSGALSTLQLSNQGFANTQVSGLPSGNSVKAVAKV